MASHRVEAGPDTVHWGYFDAALPPVLTVDSGDTVTVSTVSGGRDMMPGSPLKVPAALAAVQAAHTPKLPGHMCTGPVAVRGARAGQVLEVRIKTIELHYDWGYTYSAPQKGALPEDFDEMHLMHLALDRARMKARLPWGLELDLHPFFGVMAVAPPAGWGPLSTLPPRRNGGNLDNKELVAGTTLYIPIHVPGALFEVGDGHAAQGDGEVSQTAIETSLRGRLQLTVRKDMRLEWPLGETPTHWIAMGTDPDLKKATQIAVREAVKFLQQRKSLTQMEAYQLASIATDLRITQLVDGHVGVHVMIPKYLLAK